MLYPRSVDGEKRLAGLYDEVAGLCRQRGVDVIDLWEPLRQLALDGRLNASRYDAHPGARAHVAIAAAIHESLRARGMLEKMQEKH